MRPLGGFRPSAARHGTTLTPLFTPESLESVDRLEILRLGLRAKPSRRTMGYKRINNNNSRIELSNEGRTISRLSPEHP